VGRLNQILGVMMVGLFKRRWGDALSIFLGGLTALIIFPITVESVNWVRAWYDQQNPVVTAKLLKAERINPQTLRLQFVITRNRDCEFIRLLGMTGHGPHDMQLATMLRREDGSDPASYPTGVTAVSNPWLLSPVYGPRLMLWGDYDCDDRLVRNKIVDEVVAP
jgi:hypothetical protein